MWRNDKIYMYATVKDGKLQFTTHDWKMIGFWAWGNKDTPKFIIEKLVELYGPEEWYDVYKKFTDALLEVWDMWNFSKPTACITLYHTKGWPN